MASSVVVSRPSTMANGRSSMPCSLNQARPRTQAFSALVILCSSRSTVRFMSSHTQPQKVQVASFTMRILSLMARPPRGSIRDSLHLDIEVLGEGHAAAGGVPGHQGAGQGSIGDEQEPRGQVLGGLGLAADEGLAGGAAQAHPVVVL